jgi:hypothetical protein
VFSATNRASQEAELADEEDQKVQAYTQMSTTLVKINSPANTAVAPVLGDMIASHKDSKERAVAAQEQVGRLWQNVFSAVVEGLTAELDIVVAAAKARLQREGAAIVEELISESITRERERINKEQSDSTQPSAKRKASATDLRRQKSGSGDVDMGSFDRRHKRRREHSPAPVAGHSAQRPPLESTTGTAAATGANADMLRMMQEMMKMVQQTTTAVAAPSLAGPVPPPPQQQPAHPPVRTGTFVPYEREPLLASNTYSHRESERGRPTPESPRTHRGDAPRGANAHGNRSGYDYPPAGYAPRHY